MTKLLTALFYLVFLLVRGFGLDLTTCRMSQNEQFQNHISDSWMIGEVNTPSKIECAIVCILNSRCVSFTVNPQSKRCRLHAVKLSSSLHNFIWSAGFTYYDTCKVDSSTVGYPCTHHRDCTLPGTKCVRESCQCDAGYSYSPTQHGCLLKCPTYGTDFVPFEDYYIKQHNDIISHAQDWVCAGCCARKCLEENTFVCRTFETSDGQCTLSSLSRYTVAYDDFNTFKVFEVTYHERQCDYFTG